MIAPPLPENEAERLEALHRLGILGTPPEERFDRVIRLARTLFRVPICMVSLVDKDEQWFKAFQGVTVQSTPRKISFCGHAILNDEIFEVPDAKADPRFADNPLVTGSPHVAFYAGHPLKTLDGYRIGSFCVIDTKPRRLTPEERETLHDLAAIVETELNFATIDQARQKAAAAEQKLRELSNFQQAILNSAELSIVSTDPRGTILSMNRAAECWLGWDSREVVGQASAVIFHDETELVLRADELATATGRPLTSAFEVLVDQARAGAVEEREWSLVRKDKTSFPSLLSATPLRNPHGEISGFVLIARDIAKQKAAEQKTMELVHQLESANKTKAAFIANTSHEIRTPMNGVMGMAELLTHTDLTPHQREYVEGISRCGDSLLVIINDLLDLSKIEAGKMTLENIPYDLHRTAEHTVEMLALGAEKKDLTVLLEIDEDVPVFLQGDSFRLRQILTNLVGNAIKFTDHGSVTTRISLAANGSRIRFEVQDTGIGITPEAQDTLFQPFCQADSGTTRRFGGTGLGLSICMHLVELMDGQIGLESIRGKGSTFWFETPLRRASPPPEVLHQGQLSGYRTLIFDPDQRGHLAEHLAAIGSEAVVAASAETMLEHLRTSADRQPFHFCVLAAGHKTGEILSLAHTAQTIQREHQLPPLAILFTVDPQTPARNIETLKEAGCGPILHRPFKRPQIRSAFTQLSKIIPSRAKHPPEAATEPSRRLRVLLAEDNVLNQKVALGMLNILGHSPDIAFNGKEAVDAAALYPYDLVLMDCQMPQMDGFEATEAIRKMQAADPAQPHLPIIALSAHVTAAIHEKCSASGMDGCISKPLQLATLQEALRQYVPGASPTTPVPEITSDTTTTSNVINGPQLDELKAMQELGEPGMFREILEMFFEKAPIAAQAIADAIETGDGPALRHHAHKLAGSCGTFGADQIVQICGKLEESGETENLAQARQLHPEFQTAFAALSSFLRKELDGVEQNTQAPLVP